LTLTNDITIKRLKLHEKLIKSESSLATQIRTRRIELADYLFNRRVSEIVSFACFCGWIKQNVKHIVLQCPDYTQNRDSMLREEGTTDFRRLMITAKRVKTMINWFMKTGLLAQFSLTTKLIEWSVAQCGFLYLVYTAARESDDNSAAQRRLAGV
jgi:hypothetical protein